MSDRPVRVLIVDDEEPARHLLRVMLQAHSEVEVVGECSNGFDAVKAVSDHKPDVLFLDIQMPKLDGFEVLELIEPGPAVVFVTAYDQYAIKAFEVSAVDYLLKPFDESRLSEALTRAVGRRGQAMETSPGDIRAAAKRGIDRIVIQDRGQINIIPVHTIDYFEAQGDYVAVHTGKHSHLKQQTLKSLEAGLDHRRFVRVHRSYILNLDRLDRIEPVGKDSRVAVLRGGAEIPISRSGYSVLRELIQGR